MPEEEEEEEEEALPSPPLPKARVCFTRWISREEGGGEGGERTGRGALG